MAKHINLQKSEGIIFQAAAGIYAAYISSGRVAEGQENEWMKRSIREAITMATATDDAVISDEEIEHLESLESGELSVGRKRPDHRKFD